MVGPVSIVDSLLLSVINARNCVCVGWLFEQSMPTIMSEINPVKDLPYFRALT